MTGAPLDTSQEGPPPEVSQVEGGMNLAEIEATVFDVARLRMPKFIYDRTEPMRATRPGEKIERLESYLLDVAYARGRAEEARLYAYSAVRTLNEEWDHLQNWEMSFDADPAKAAALAARATQPQIKEAKRGVAPQLYDSIEKGLHLIKRLSEQIKRLEKDEDVASRAYTLISNA